MKDNELKHQQEIRVEDIENFPGPDKQNKLDLLSDAILHLRTKFTYIEIADILNLSPRTVYRKMSSMKKNFIPLKNK